jgi:ubiquinol-cytochrome c reductase cytochrome c subunit
MFTIVLLVIALAGAAETQAPAPVATASPSAESGKRLYMKYTCYFCHGTVGQGGLAGARVAGITRNLQGFTRYVRQPAGQMPAYTEKILSDADLAEMYAYLRALPPAKPAREIPLLDQLKPR